MECTAENVLAQASARSARKLATLASCQTPRASLSNNKCALLHTRTMLLCACGPHFLIAHANDQRQRA